MKNTNIECILLPLSSLTSHDHRHANGSSRVLMQQRESSTLRQPPKKPTDDKALASSSKSFGGYDYPNIYDESLPMLWASKLVYTFADLVEQGRSGKLDLSDTFPPEVLARFE